MDNTYAFDGDNEDSPDLAEMPIKVSDLRRSNAMFGADRLLAQKARKTLWPSGEDDYDEDEDEEERPMDESETDLGQPDLIAYFAQWDIPWKDCVLMCRAYASYLTAAHRTEVKPAAVEKK